MAGLYIVKIAMQIRTTQKKYANIITEALYTKSMNNDYGVLAYLIDATIQQEVKESIIAFFFRWQAKKKVSPKH